MAKRSRGYRFKPSHGRMALRAGAWAGRALRKSWGRTSGSSRSKRTIEPVPITGHHDYKVDYVRKRMPRRKRKRWTSFKKKVDYIADKRLGLKKWVINDVQRVQSLADTTNYFSTELYSIDGVTGHKDVGDIARATMDPTIFDDLQNSTLSTLTNTSKLITFESANIEVSITNNATTSVILECYHFKCRKDGRQFSNGALNNPGGYYEMGFLKQGVPTDPDTGEQPDPSNSDPLTVFTVGSTPFQSPFFCSHFQIVRREKFTVPAQGTIQKSLRIPMNKTVNISTLRSLNIKRGWTEGFLWQMQGAPGYASSVVRQATISDVVVASVKRYSYYLRAGGFDQSVLKYP